MPARDGRMCPWRTSSANTGWGRFAGRATRARGGAGGEGAAPAKMGTTGGHRPTMAHVFGPGGLLDRCMIGGYEHRPGQLEMANAVNDAFANHHHVIVEAGTGTGKTLAYLLPAICSGRRVVISTATKSLQEQ